MTETRVLIFALIGADSERTVRILRAANLEAEVCVGIDALCKAIDEGAGAVVLAEEALSPDVTARLVSTLARQPAWSDLPILVSSAQREVSAQGFGQGGLLGASANVTLLERPIRLRLMLSAVLGALRARRRQYESRRLVEEVAASEARFRAIQENTPDGLMIFRPVKDADGTITDFEWLYTNPAAERALGRADRGLAGRRLLVEFPRLVHAGHFALYKEAVEKGTVQQRDFPPREAGEQEYRNTAFPVGNDLALIFEDITDRQRLERDRIELVGREKEARALAEQNSRMKDEFLATISHELRTPLNAMLGWARMLSTGELDVEGQKRAVEVIQRNAIAQSQLIEDLLDVSRIISGNVRLNLAPTSVVAVLEAAIDAVRPAIEAKAIRFSTSFDRDAPPIAADGQRLQQVIWNLLTNAVKFTPKGGSITLTFERTASGSTITVTDTGQGIPPAFIPRVFERFQQADARITRAHGGLGLGLSIALHFTELHGGTIAVESPGEGLGATFRVTLPTTDRVTPRPALSAFERQSIPGPALEGSTALRGVRVLLVEDEGDSLELLVAVLERWGAVAYAVESARDALELLKTTAVDVIVSDIGLPGMDGYALIRAIRALPHPVGSLPAAALTAFARKEDRDKALAAGFQLHVSKPIEPAQLLEIVSSLAGVSAA